MIKVDPQDLQHCGVKAATVEALTFEETEILMGWANWQHADYSTEQPLALVLDLYRISARYDSLEGYFEEEGEKAVKAVEKLLKKYAKKAAR